MTQRIVQDQNIGKNLRILRLKADMTQEQVSQKLQLMGLPMSREIYAQIEMGRHHIPITVLQGLKIVLKAEWDEMLALSEPLRRSYPLLTLGAFERLGRISSDPPTRGLFRAADTLCPLFVFQEVRNN